MVDRVCVCLISSIHWHILSILFYSHVHMFVWTSVYMSSYKYTYFAWLLAQLDNQLTVNRALSFSSPKNPTHTTPTRVLSRSRSLSRSCSVTPQRKHAAHHSQSFLSFYFVHEAYAYIHASIHRTYIQIQIWIYTCMCIFLCRQMIVWCILSKCFCVFQNYLFNITPTTTTTTNKHTLIDMYVNVNIC